METSMVKKIRPVLQGGSVMRERIYKALCRRFEAEQEDALLKIDLLLSGPAPTVMVDHIDITKEIDQLLGKLADSAEKMAKLRQYFGTN